MSAAVNNFPVLVLLLVLALLGLVLLVPSVQMAMMDGVEQVLYTLSQHAVERHGSLGEYIFQQCNPNNFQLHLYNPERNRHAFACWLPDLGKWGVSIFEERNGWEHVTSFPNRSRTIEELLRYLLNRGYAR
jgi:hypothetical protein